MAAPANPVWRSDCFSGKQRARNPEEALPCPRDHLVAPPPTLDDAAFLRRFFDVARRARERGKHPFGAILAGPDGEVLIESENGYLPDRDMTGHAERLLATQACKRL